MQREDDRRAAGVQRIPVERIVDVCATGASPASTFQGRSLNVSGRGMSVRSTHVPALHARVVVRFQEDGAEVIAEGQVAWRSEKAGGAEFGVRFTALDSRSVQALEALCQSLTVQLEAGARKTDARETDEGDTEPAPPAGSQIKVHIDGLGVPMQAHVREQGERRVALGSPLDFLRVGRSVQVEDVVLGERRGARIEAVRVAIDPTSRVPELVVGLCYEGARMSVGASSQKDEGAPASAIVPTAKDESVKAGAVKAEPVKVEALKAEPAKAELAKAEPATAAPAESKRISIPLPRPEVAAAAPEEVDVDLELDGDPPATVHTPHPDTARRAQRRLARVLGTDASARRANGAGRRSEAESRRAEAAERRAEVAEAEHRAELKRRAEAEAERRADALRQAQAADERLDEAERRSDTGESSDEAPPSSGPSLEIEEYSSASEAERLRQRLDGVLDGLATAARATGERCRRLGGVATRGARWVADHAESAGRRALSARRATAPRRTAAAPRSSLRASAARMTSRMMQGRGAGGASVRRGPPPQLMIGAGLAVLLIGAGAWWGHASPATPAALSAAPRTSSVPAETALAASPAAPGAALPPAPAALETPAQELPPPSTTPSRILLAPDENESAGSAESRSAVAQAPMFGAASLGESPRRAAPSRKAPSEKRMLARATSNAGLFEPAPAPSPRKKGATEFSSGRLNLPIVHRIRLNEPGTTLRGERTPTGFDVIIPGRKTLESGAAIAKRDGRVAKVTTKNGGDGARVSLRFRSGIPAYKARLRGDYLEIFISE